MSNEFLTFKLDGSQYAVEVTKVQEVLEYTKITKIPCTASYIEGIINSREQGIPVISLRKKFEIEPIPVDKQTRIIVLEIETAGGSVTFGAIADSVQAVTDLDEAQMEKAPQFGNGAAQRFIRGIGKKDGSFIIILDVDKIFTEDETELLRQSSQQPVETGGGAAAQS